MSPKLLLVVYSYSDVYVKPDDSYTVPINYYKESFGPRPHSIQNQEKLVDSSREQYSDPHRKIFSEIGKELRPNEYFSYNDPHFLVKEGQSYSQRINDIMGRVGTNTGGSESYSQQVMVDPMPVSLRNPYKNIVYQDILSKGGLSAIASVKPAERYAPFPQQQELYLKRQQELMMQGPQKTSSSDIPRDTSPLPFVQHFSTSSHVHFLNSQEPGRS